MVCAPCPMHILGVEIDNLSRAEILARVERFLAEPKFHQIATVNPEFLVEADRNPEFKKLLNDCDLRVADGFGISLAAFFRSLIASSPFRKGEGREGVFPFERFPGVDLTEELLRMANERHLSVFLAVRADGLSSFEQVRIAILKKYPRLKINGLDIQISSLIGNWKLEIGNSAIVFCNFGSPAQEFFLAKLKSEGIQSRVAMGVGGAFDYLTGKQMRAPWCLQKCGLEWLWRLLSQPWRWHRIWTAVAVFPMKILTKKDRS